MIRALATTAPLAELFSDASVVQALLDFEAALARAEARAGMMPSVAAEAIASAATASNFDTAALTRETLRAGTPGIPLAKALREKVRARNVQAADYVHFGATSQDASDTAIVLLLKRAQPLLQADCDRLCKALRYLSNRHAHTVMLGRTLLQPAPPITFGLKAAGWFAAVNRGAEELERAFSQALTFQFGGAAGTLAALGDRGI